MRQIVRKFTINFSQKNCLSAMMWAFDGLNINRILFLLLLYVLAIMFVVVEQCMCVWHHGRRASMVDDVESIDRRADARTPKLCSRQNCDVFVLIPTYDKN